MLQHDLDKDRTNVFVKYLPPEIDSAGLHQLFEEFGKIVSAKVMENQDTGQSLGYGFVRFTLPKEAKKAICSMAGKRLNNKTLLCRLSNHLAFTEPSTNLYIKPLPPGMNEAKLIEEFSKHGTIVTVKIVYEKNSPNTRIGFVRYENVECASKAIEERNGTKLSTELSPLIVKYAESEEKRALRKAHALPKHIAKNAAYQTTNNINTNLNSSTNFPRNSAPNSKFMPRYNTPILPYEQYMPPYDAPSENLQEWTYVPSLPSPTYTDHGGGGPPFGNSYQVMLVPYVEGMPFAVYPPRYMPNTLYY